MSMQHLQAGVDLLNADCINKANVMQAIQGAQPYPNQGFVINSATAPDTVTYPELINFLWLQPQTNPALWNLYYYNGTSWQLFALIDGSRLANGSVSLSKISLVGSTPYDILQVNSTGTSLIWTDLGSAIPTSSLSPAKLIPPGVGKFVLGSTVDAWGSIALLTFLQTVIDDNTLPISKLVKYTIADTYGAYLRTNLAGTALEWSRVDVANITAVGFAAGQVARRNSTNDGWEAYTPVVGGPRYLGSPIVVYSGGAAGWTTYSASMATLAAKSAAILQIEILWNTSVDGNISVLNRAATGGIELVNGRIAATDATQYASQSTTPVTADGKFDFEVLVGGTAVPTVTISLVGYYL